MSVRITDTSYWPTRSYVCHGKFARLMLYRRGSSVKSSFSNFRLITKVMSSKARRLQDPVVNEFKTRKGQRYCFEESISKTLPSMKCKKINHEKTNDGSQGCASELTELLCDKLSQDEKKIYFAHQHAVMVREQGMPTYGLKVNSP